MSYDFHSHILPHIDDGSKNTEQSIAMLKMLKNDDVSDVVATPHFYPGEMDINDFIAKRDYAYNQLMKKIDDRDIPRIHKGAEVMLTTELADDPDLEKLCIEGTKYILIELPYAYWSNWVYQILYRIICDRHLFPIIAHLDRYFSYIKNSDKKIISRLLTMEVTVQLNATAVIDWKTKHRAFQLIDKNCVHILGTDCHDDKLRFPKMAKARKIIKKRFGEDKLKKFDENSRHILGMDN